MKQVPLISVVTPSFNQAAFIGEALESVRHQNYDNCEHLIIDGISTDGTIDILNNLTAGKGQANVSWLSELDSGQSEALNKGFRRAKGEIIGWLNSDDRYRAGCFAQIIKAFEDNPGVDIVYGDYLVVDESGKALKIKREIEFDKFVLLYHRVLCIPTPTTFFRRRIFEENNWLNEGLHYAMDLEFFIRLSMRGYRFKHIPAIIADFRLQPNSKTCSHPDRQQREHQQIIFGTAPIFRHVKSTRFRSITLSLLRSVAFVERCSKKMLKGYYWERLRPNGSSLTNI